MFENLIKKLFSNAKLNIKINDRFGNPVSPEEWFLVPLEVIKEAIQKIIDGTITKYIYDPTLAKMVEIKLIIKKRLELWIEKIFKITLVILI